VYDYVRKSQCETNNVPPEVEMRWKKNIYWLIGLCLILSAVVKAVMKKQGITDPLSWGNILSELGPAMAFILIGLSMILDYRDLLDWFGTHLRWNPPTFSFRIGGWFFLIGGLLFLAVGIMNALIALSIIPNLYLP
jgi:hypothetical protein